MHSEALSWKSMMVFYIVFSMIYKHSKKKLGIDIWETIEVTETSPIALCPSIPSPGVEGHCTAVDSFYLSWKAKEFEFYPRFIAMRIKSMTR